MTAIADIEQGVVLARVDIAVPPARVWTAITTDELTAWWGSPEMYTTTKFTMDMRAGGAWRTEGVGADGSAFHVEGVVVEIDAPKRLVHTWKPSWDPSPASTVTYSLEPTPTGTRVTVRHTGLVDPQSCRGHGDGWVRVLGWLGGHLAPDTRGFFLARLIAPRTTFPADMTPDERVVMMAHAAYCKTQIAEGRAVVFGPVADPAGAWGLGILRGADLAAIRAITDADPVITSNKGFRYEILPMLSAMV